MNIGRMTMIWFFAAITGVTMYACSDDPTPTASTTSADGGQGDSSRSDTGTGSDGSSPDGATGTRTATVTINPFAGTGGTTTGMGTFTETNGEVTLTLNVTNAPPGSRGVHIHVGSTCATAGVHFNPNPTTLNGEFKSMDVNDAGQGSLTDTKSGLSLTQAADGGTGIVGRTLVVHGVRQTYPDGGPVLTEAGTPAPPPISGCGVITAQ